MRILWGIGLVASLVACGCGSSGGGFAPGDASVDVTVGADGSNHKKDTSVGSLGSPDTTKPCTKGITCASKKAECGFIDNGCGGTIQCGSCKSGDTCGVGGANKCGAACVPTTCKALGFTCGPAGDGCGGTLSCGTCTAPETCGGGGKSKCGVPDAGCKPLTCSAQNISCGPASDGCGNTLDCGSCPTGQTCGGGGVPFQCGSGGCTPATCLPGQCGSAPDGCGGSITCATCTLPDVCGGSVDAGVSYCGIPATCTGLCTQQVACGPDGGVLPDGATPVTTTITGTVYAPNGVDPLPNVLVYIPNAPVLPFTPGVACEPCSAGVSGSPLVSAATDTHGNFTLQNAPVGSNIPLVIQTGRWRRQTVIPSVAACTNTALPTCTAATAASGACLTSLPQTQAQGDIPLTAFATGSIDALECVMLKIGVAQSEFTNPGAGGRMNLFVGFEQKQLGVATVLGGARMNTSTPTEDVLVGSSTTLNQYDMVLFPCEEGQLLPAYNVLNQQTGASLGKWSTLQAGYQSNVINYANAGGRIFATHYSYIWLYNDAPWSSTAQWNPNQIDPATYSSGYGGGDPPIRRGTST